LNRIQKEFLESDLELFILQFSISLSSVCGLRITGNVSVRGSDLERITSLGPAPHLCRVDVVIKDGLKGNGSDRLSSKQLCLLSSQFILPYSSPSFTALILLIPGHSGKQKDDEL